MVLESGAVQLARPDVAAAPTPPAYIGWTVAEIAADQALAASTSALGQADGLLDPELDAIFARRPKPPPRRSSAPPKLEAMRAPL